MLSIEEMSFINNNVAYTFEESQNGVQPSSNFKNQSALNQSIPSPPVSSVEQQQQNLFQQQMLLSQQQANIMQQFPVIIVKMI